MQTDFHSNGKLLLTSEFLVIDGAKALALPCQYGQSMHVEPLEVPEILWESYTDEGKMWYEGIFSIENGKIINIPFGHKPESKEISKRLEQILNAIMHLNPTVFSQHGYTLKTRLEFPQMWGLGSSSTLIANLAEWAQVNPYELLEMTFGGSAYDIACAQSEGPIIYQRRKEKSPIIEKADFDPAYKDFLFFVHLGKKQNTREVVARYKKLNPGDKQDWVEHASRLTDQIMQAQDLMTFEKLIEEHERLISNVLEMHTMINVLFQDYPRFIKSLGAWGGDFVLATGGSDERQYFKDKGFTTIVRYKDMVL